ncbi:hypothetical protein VA596_04275 [Amycolatopsis sp., V23-08]|uniref:DUF4145 domain-containing protein n=1 Tax=Amycolatopsis heterodermiae TaxID=3110235 RepID=A0ABU5QXS4_9PSEU|nr:hypothetical protein [Amycolatopsis sp., V23-08]MEA5358741.1 hypothetical protein [Amycolatopsis sp., V23-08]
MAGIVNTTQDVLVQIDSLLAEYDTLEQAGKLVRHSADENSVRRLATRMQAAVQRLAPRDSVYAREAHGIRPLSPRLELPRLNDLLLAMKEDIQAGWLTTVVELVHADTHKDYLDMAEELLKKKYKDAAAVIAGSSLEVHIRALCIKHGVPISVAGKPKKADTMNADLKKALVYGGLEQKQITSWLALRNSAAHGQYSDYVESDVRQLIDGIQAFAIKYPA